MALVWREKMSIGNNVLDEDHKKLIDIINKVEESLRNDDKKQLSLMFDRLSKYSEEHFTLEEKYAHSVEYTRLRDLRAEHERLIKDLGKYRLSAIEESWTEEAIDKFCLLLRNWLIDHVMKEDMLMKPLFSRYHPDYKIE